MEEPCNHRPGTGERLASLEEWREAHRNQKQHTVAIWASVIIITATAMGFLWNHQNDGHPARVEQRVDYWKERVEILENRVREIELNHRHE